MANDAPLRPADRVKDIRYAVRDVVVLADQLRAQGMRMSYLNIGDPNIFDFAPPSHIVEATVEAMRANRNGYAPSDGVDEALEAIRGDAERKGISSVVHSWVGSGCSEVIDMALTALLDPGDNVLTPAPGYPLYTALLSKLGAENRPYLLDEDSGWQPDIEDIIRRIDDRTKALVVINPNNPTGSIADEATLRRLVEVAKERNLLLIADEIYDRILFSGQEHVALASLDPEATVLTLGGLSKNWVAPGWRIGWGVISGIEEKIGAYVQAVQQLGRARLSANHPEQYAIKPAIEGSQHHLVDLIGRVEAQTDLAMKRINAIDGISCVAPKGAFYAFARLHDEESDASFCRELMQETGVVVVPGSGFGQKPGTQHFRIVTLPPLETIDYACSEIERFMKARRAAR